MAFVLTAVFIGCEDDYEAPNSFSDVGWYTSLLRDTEFKLNVNKFMSFSDLSQGTIEHTWTIGEGSFFLGGPISKSDSIFDNFIIEPGEYTSSDETVHVLFKNSGLNTVNLYNTYKDSVTFKGVSGIEEVIFPSKKVGDKWVIDTTFVVDVYDTIVPTIIVKQNGVVVSHENESDVIFVEAGDNLEFIDATVIGRPNTRLWSVGGSTATDSVSKVVFKKLGTWKGSFTASRTGETVPGDYEKYNIPATFEVIPSSKPFELYGDVMEMENQTIHIPFNGEFVDFTAQESFFTVMVNGSEFVIATVTLNEDDATILDVKLQDPIYREDVITVSLADGSDLESTDTRKPVAFTDVPVAMFQHELITFDFETGGSNWTAHVDNKASTSIYISEEQAASGTKSLKVESTESGNWSAFENPIDQYSLKTGQVIQYEMKVYKATGAALNFLAPWVSQLPGNTITQYWDNQIKAVPFDTWTTIRFNKKWASTLTGDDFFVYIRHNGIGTLYFDDLRIIEVDDRP